MASLEALLPHPVVAEIERHVIARCAGANHNHPAGRAHEFRRGQRRLARVLEYDARTCPFTDRIPDRLAERTRAFRPLAVGLRVSGIGHHAPVVEQATIDDTNSAVLHAERSLALVGHDGDSAPAFRPCDLERHAAKAARASPDEDDIVWLDYVRFPSH